MKKLPMPKTNDAEILEKMKNYLNSPTGVLMQDEYTNILQKYKDYEVNKGNPFKCRGGTISNALKARLEYHYNNSREDLNYISIIRNDSSPDVCPLCGSPKTGTLDHFLPQANYPEWILFSRNLVPACDCNSKRQNNVHGTNINQRILHPYYDDCLNYRLVIAKISPPFDNPEISIVPVGRSVIHNDTVQFHIDKVINNSTIIRWMKKRWQTMVKKPRLIITAIPKNSGVISMCSLEECLRETLSDQDEQLHTSNNWYSMFLAGILSSREARAWILSRHNAIVSGLIDGFE